MCKRSWFNYVTVFIICDLGRKQNSMDCIYKLVAQSILMETYSSNAFRDYSIKGYFLEEPSKTY